MSWLNMTSLLSHQTHLFAIFLQISTPSVISLTGCHIIGSITVATARNAAFPPGALNFINSPEGWQDEEGGGRCRPLSESISPSRHHWLLRHLLSSCIHCRPGAYFLRLRHQSDWLRKCITFVVFSVCCYDASYLFTCNNATALTLYLLTIPSSTRTVHFQQGLISISQIHLFVPMSRKQSTFS